MTNAATTAKLDQDLAHARSVSLARSAAAAQARADARREERLALEDARTKAAIEGMRDQLREVARLLDSAADRAWTLAAEDDRHRAAAQVRMIAQIATRDRNLLLGHAWIDAGRLYLETLERADMDAVHASRSSRRA